MKTIYGDAVAAVPVACAANSGVACFVKRSCSKLRIPVKPHLSITALS